MGTENARENAFRQIYPEVGRTYQLNTCADPDCGNFGVIPRQLGYRSQNSLHLNSSSSAIGIGAGLGHYVLAGTSGKSKSRRESTVFEHADEPFRWFDDRNIVCRYTSANKQECGIAFGLLSDIHLEEEIERLRRMNGVLDGPKCGACGKRYLDAPEEFVLNGAKEADPGSPLAAFTPIKAVRVIHAPCRGLQGAKFWITPPFHRHKKVAENVLILRGFANSGGVVDVRRLLSQTMTEKCGASRIYDRLFLLEEALLAFEQAQLDRWRARLDEKAAPRTNRLCHDDIILSVNWPTQADRRTTHLACSVTADAESGYVYRIDVDFDPSVEAAALLKEAYLDPDDDIGFRNIRHRYFQQDGTPFEAPPMAFQRPTGRLDENSLFATAIHHIGHFTKNKIRRMEGPFQERMRLKARLMNEATRLYTLYNGWFDLGRQEPPEKSSFNGAKVRPIYTKGAHMALVREMLPHGDVHLVTEEEGTLARLLGRIFREEIRADRFTWLTISFAKNATKPVIMKKLSDFNEGIKAFEEVAKASGLLSCDASFKDVRLAFTRRFMSAFGGEDKSAPKYLKSAAYTNVWLRAPVQAAGELDKVVGFQIPKESLRHRLKRMTPSEALADDETAGEIAEEVLGASLQAASTFMNSLRERVSSAARTDSRGAHVAGSYRQGAVFNPRVLIAILNIYRVYYNFCELRPFVSATNIPEATTKPRRKVRHEKVPGTDERVPIKTRSRHRPRLATPAMRHGIDTREVETEIPDRNLLTSRILMTTDAEAPPPLVAATASVEEMIYKPWMFYGTPLWEKFTTGSVTRRSKGRNRTPTGKAAARSKAKKLVRPVARKALDP